MRRSNLRVVPDTNVVVSAALFFPSIPQQVVDYVVENGILLLSTATRHELGEVILRPRFDRRASRERRREFLNTLILAAEEVEISHRIAVCRDPADDKFLELALSGNASHIITGDNDLLTLHPFRGISIIPPALFLAQQPG